jgi:RNA polymerase sigma factor (sigma-70 family)
MSEERASQHISRETIDEGYTELPLDDGLQYISQKLTPQTREVMMRRFGEGQRYNDIADGLGISRIAVYKHIAQALTKLKKQFVWKS